MSVRAGDLAVVVKGLWPNVGRIVYVDRFIKSWDFTRMGLDIRPGWSVRTWSQEPLETIAGPRMSGYTPQGSLKALDPLPPALARRIQQQMAVEDFNEAMTALAEIFERQEQRHKRRKTTARRVKRSPMREPLTQLQLVE
jgi:hypothetical protein